MTCRSVFRVASFARCTERSYRAAAIPTRIKMIVITIISSINVNASVPDRTWRLRPDIQPPVLKFRFMVHLYHHYQSEYFVPSLAVPCDFEYTSKIFLPPQLVESGSS